MKVKIKSLLCNKPKWVSNQMEINSIDDLDKIIRAVVTDRSATLIREDGKEVEIVNVGVVRDEVYNQKQLLLDWCNLKTDEFPVGGSFRGASV